MAQIAPVWEGTLASGATLKLSGLSVAVCAGTGSCVTYGALGALPFAEDVKATVAATAAATLVLAVFCIGSAISFAVMVTLRAMDEAVLGRVWDCCEVRAKYILPSLGAACAMLNLVFVIVVVSVANPKGLFVTSAVGGGASMGIVNIFLLLGAAVLVALSSGEIQSVKYVRRLTADASARRNRRLSQSILAGMPPGAAASSKSAHFPHRPASPSSESPVPDLHQSDVGIQIGGSNPVVRAFRATSESK
jgi:hypothetical protein